MDIDKELDALTTPHLTDGCMRAGVAIRAAPFGIRPILPTMRLAGRARPVRHVGSIDAFLEAFETATRGEVLVVDNNGRLDEACIGDLIALEARDLGMAGIVIWGLHRDNLELMEAAFPVFSLGALPNGPQRLDTRRGDVFKSADIGDHIVTASDFVVGDSNGVLFISERDLKTVVEAAASIREVERLQLQEMANGRSLRRQIRFSEYVSKRENDETYTFRRHLQAIEGAGEV